MTFLQRVAIANIQGRNRKAKANLKNPGSLSGANGSFAEDLKEVLFTTYGSLSEKERAKTSEREWEKLCKLNWEEQHKPPFSPDLYEIDEATKTIVLYEIEDQSPLTDKKLADMVWWADKMEGYTVRLFITDRYGLSERELAIEDLFTLALVPHEISTEQQGMAGSKRAMRKRRPPYSSRSSDNFGSR